MSGFLLGIDASHPPPSSITSPLSPVIWRGADALVGYAHDAGAAYELVASFLWNKPGAAASSHPAFGQDAAHPDWSEYEQFLTGLAGRYKEAVRYWEFWNEPDFDHFWPHATHADTRCGEPLENDPLRDRLFEAYGHFVQVMRGELGPEAQLVAPSLAAYCEPFLRAFLQYAAAHRLEVNVLAWHELRASQEDLPSIAEHLAQARREFFYDPHRPETAPYRNLHLRGIQINESVGPDHVFHPGDTAAYLYFMERGGADAAVRACWPDEGAANAPGANGCNNNSIDNLLAPAGSEPGTARQPRPNWWLYARYAQLQHRRVPCEPRWADAVCLAGTDAAGAPTVIVGRYGTGAQPATLRLRLDGLAHDAALAGRNARVVVARLPAGPTPLPQLPTEAAFEATIRSGLVDLELPPLAAHEALLIRIEPPWEQQLRGDTIALLGEVHDNAEQQRLRLEMLRRAILAGWRPVIAMEQFDREHQRDIDQARRERPQDADYVIARAAPESGRPNSGWNWSYYRPYVALALQFDLPLVAANLSRDDAEKIVMHGYSSVFDAATSERLGLEQVPSRLLSAQESEVDIGHCHALPRALLPAMARAQIARDAVMAATLREHATPGAVLLTGNGHARRDIGVPAWLDVGARMHALSIGFLERGDPKPPAAFDAVVVTAPAPRADPCVPLQRSLRKP
jgi:uncharacterized iron-regulated protein